MWCHFFGFKGTSLWLCRGGVEVLESRYLESLILNINKGCCGETEDFRYFLLVTLFEIEIVYFQKV